MSQMLYDPLDLGEIRLLEIQPATLDCPIVRCKTIRVTLLNAPQYVALSYRWSTVISTESICVDGVDFGLTTNLLAALKRLRQDTGAVMIWADAICIDQSNVSERNSQVQMMKKIYSQASLVVIWLGVEKERSSEAFSWIRLWSDLAIHDNFPAFIELHPEALSSDMWLATRKLLSRSWWKRIWVLQEVVVSQDAVLMCGEDQISWDEISCAIANWRLLRVEKPLIMASLTEEQTTLLMLIQDCGTSQDMAWERLQYWGKRNARYRNIACGIEERKYPFLRLLQLSQTMKSTDPRDKIYALLGLDSDNTAGISVDYSKSVAQVYTDTVQVLIEMTKSLAVLSCGSSSLMTRHLHEERLPSWVPDFRCYHERSYYRLTELNYSASGDSSAETVVSQMAKTLTSRGAICGLLDELIPHDQEAQFFHAKGSSTHPTGITYIEAYLRTRVTDKTRPGSAISDTQEDENGQSLLRFCVGFLFSQPRHGNILDYADALHEQVCHWIVGQSIESIGQCILEYATAASAAGAERVFFSTAQGYVGLGPMWAKKGDVICILYGSNLP